MIRRRTVPLVLAVVLATACGGSPEVVAPDAATTPPAAAPKAVAPPGEPASPAAPATSDAGGNLEALDFVAPDLSGGQVRGADYAGEDVVLWMWAPW